MSKQRRFLRLGLAFALLMGAGADRAIAVAYQATLLATPTPSYANAYGVSGTSIVGGSSPGALLWNGAANTYVSLNPGPDWTSFANAVDGSHQVGSGQPSGSNEHALLWNGTAASYVDLHPDGFADSLARGVSGNTQVGSGLPNSNIGSGGIHALLWHGTAASAVDLSSAAYFLSEALGVGGNLQVGYGSGSTTGGNNHALVWQGTAASVVDLHSFLGPEFVSSVAEGVDASGRIVGYAITTDSSAYAVEWTPVPEPATCMLAVIGLAAVGGCRRGRTANSRSPSSIIPRARRSSSA
ncbi:MAG TPA: PEP-CTERM sorting domain-containing protein [Lacipirellulaceae bacterium]|nr:PEP-CTERM sorting domain-containing protein [Lacipirellulaceae bacterium]